MHYSHSPLTEAIIDIQVDLPDSATLDVLASIQKGQQENYPIRQNRMLFQGQFSTEPSQLSATGSQTHIGYSYISKDKRQVAQARLDGFTFSRLAPYESWSSFQQEARQWWEIYKSVAQPIAIKRVAVRYINRLDLPLPVNNLRDYLRTVPEISSELPQNINDYFMQLQIPQEELRAMLIINQALLPPNQKNIVSVLLDIDLGRSVDLPENEIDLWPLFEELRHYKNKVFEACITERTRELIR